ncbi:MAG: hypothetical protein IKV62_01070 [Bacteroidales bacterium]|nr:hypothetical protein [Bacteroidales bacterium]
MSRFLPTSSWRSMVLVCGLFIVSLLSASCAKESKLTEYDIVGDFESFTNPRYVEMLADPAVNEAYKQLLSDFEAYLSNVRQHWDVFVDNDHYKAEDKNALDRYNKLLPRMQAMETQCKKRLEELDPQPGSNFYFSFVFKLTRYVPVDHSTICLQEYRFELRH